MIRDLAGSPAFNRILIPSQMCQNSPLAVGETKPTMHGQDVVNHEDVTFLPIKSNCFRPIDISYVLDYFRFDFTSVSVRCVGRVHVVWQLGAFKHGRLFIISVVVNIDLVEPNGTSRYWVRDERVKYVPVEQAFVGAVPLEVKTRFVKEIFDELQ